jgi:chromosome segregation ATPase
LTKVSENLFKILIFPQLQQDKKRLREEAERATLEAGELRQEVELLRGRLEETEWGLCQKTGELSLLKAQLKDSQVSRGLC